jgi:hypothetical protein
MTNETFGIFELRSRDELYKPKLTYGKLLTLTGSRIYSGKYGPSPFCIIGSLATKSCERISCWIHFNHNEDITFGKHIGDSPTASFEAKWNILEEISFTPEDLKW